MIHSFISLLTEFLKFLSEAGIESSKNAKKKPVVQRLR